MSDDRKKLDKLNQKEKEFRESAAKKKEEAEKKKRKAKQLEKEAAKKKREAEQLNEEAKLLEEEAQFDKNGAENKKKKKTILSKNMKEKAAQLKALEDEYKAQQKAIKARQKEIDDEFEAKCKALNDKFTAAPADVDDDGGGKPPAKSKSAPPGKHDNPIDLHSDDKDDEKEDTNPSAVAAMPPNLNPLYFQHQQRELQAVPPLRIKPRTCKKCGESLCTGAHKGASHCIHQVK